MGTTGKVITGLVAVVVVVAAVLVTTLVKNLDDFIRQTIETTGTQVTQTSVTLDAAVFTLRDGRGELHGLRVANPPGYKTEHALQMQQIALQVEPGSLTGDVIVIREILVDGAQLVAEQKALTTNLKDLLKNIEETSGTATPTEPAAEPIRLMVEKFSFINSSAQVVTQQWGEKTLPITDIVLTDIGDRETGLTPEQLAQTIGRTLMLRVQRVVTDYLGDLAKDTAKKELEKQLESKLDDNQKKALKGLKSMFDK